MKRLATLFLAAQIGVVYSQNTGRVRSIIVPDNDAELASVPLRNGEALEKMDRAQIIREKDIQDTISARSQKVPVSDRYAVVDDKGNVVGAILADPLIDSIPGMQLVQSDTAGPGWTYSSANGFKAPPPTGPDTHADVRVVP